MTLHDDLPGGDPQRFGTEAFYAAIGRAFVAMCAVVPVLFLVEALDVGLGYDLDLAGGIIPRRVEGLDGVFFSPFLHADFNHLYSNSVPLVLLGTFVLAAGFRRFVWSTVMIVLVSGLGVWFTGSPDTVVVGASGVIFGYLGVLLTRGLVERSWWNFAVVLLVGLLYGWQLFGILPTDERISWQGHLFGLVGGVAAAIVFRRRFDAGNRHGPTLTPPL
ncbi:rhomboid family intramembrane serine protease [Micromonospora olivasterospora]|uniref:rhomboid family intramembrane serine protease n=1 Tax=Micromonospora olivasterospora TaxID=1880 RepID=UPI00119D2DEA|nr:rhomboid family intramembrane serine protease [Micromonospora olivasterospora]